MSESPENPPEWVQQVRVCGCVQQRSSANGFSSLALCRWPRCTALWFQDLSVFPVSLCTVNKTDALLDLQTRRSGNAAFKDQCPQLWVLLWVCTQWHAIWQICSLYHDEWCFLFTKTVSVHHVHNVNGSLESENVRNFLQYDATKTRGGTNVELGQLASTHQPRRAGRCTNHGNMA